MSQPGFAGVVLRPDRPHVPVRLLQLLGYGCRAGMGNRVFVDKYESVYMDLLCRLLTEPPETEVRSLILVPNPNRGPKL